jgi:hypothetical protein
VSSIDSDRVRSSASPVKRNASPASVPEWTCDSTPTARRMSCACAPRWFSVRVRTTRPPKRHTRVTQTHIPAQPATSFARRRVSPNWPTMNSRGPFPIAAVAALQSYTANEDVSFTPWAIFVNRLCEAAEEELSSERVKVPLLPPPGARRSAHRRVPTLRTSIPG